MAFGPAAGLELVDALVSDGSLDGYHLLPSVRGDLLAKLERFPEARAEFESAASLTRNEGVRALLLERAAKCRETGAGRASASLADGGAREPRDTGPASVLPPGRP
jgi:predicted RNA polymerase sigma factor